MPLRPGSRVDRYTLVECLGEGGQGLVWKVYDPVAKAGRALKLVDLGRRPANALTRARREARALAALDHPALVRCHALFELPAEDLLGLVFDLVRGQSLADLLDDPRLTHPRRIAILDHVASALAYVHARGITHRDLKPENVLVANTFFAEPTLPGAVRLIDFGIAAPIGNPRRLTREGSVVGTDRYLPPELLSSAARESGTDDGVARDLFGFGLLAWELMTGTHPTGASPAAPVSVYARAYDDAIAGRRAWPPSGLRGTSAGFIAACLALDPLVRLDAARGLGRPLQLEPTRRRAALDRATAARTAPMTSPPRDAVHPRTSMAPTVDAAPRRASRFPAILAILAVLVVIGTAALALGFGFLQWAAKDPTPVEQPTTPIPPPVTTRSQESATAGLVPCCPADGKCHSDRACAPGLCNAPIPDRSWRLRLQGVLGRAPNGEFTQDLTRSIPRLRVCIARPDEAERCEPVAPIGTGSKASPSSIVVHTSDLEQGALTIRVTGEGGLVAAGHNAASPEGIRVSALCIGVALYVGPRESAAVKITGFLDDP